MPLRESVVILPGASLEDLPTRIQGKEAAELLAAWTLPWHPVLVAQTGGLPAWKPAGASVEELQERIVLLPSLAREAAPAGWIEQIQSDLPQDRLWTDLGPRRKALPRILAAASHENGPPALENVAPLAQELAPDFFALALTSLIVELIGHTMHYSSNVDRDSLETAALAAAKAACEGDAAIAEEKLQRAFDLLAEARDYYYPVESFFLDVTLLAPSVWGRPLIGRLAGEVPTNVLMTATQAQAMAAASPDSVAALRAAVADRKTTLIGGGMDDVDQTPMSLEAILDDLHAAHEVYQEHIGGPPTVYGRFRGGVSPLLPCILEGLGYGAALLAAFDGSQLPTADHSRFRWEGADGSAIDALGLVPGDAGDAGCLLQLADRLGHSMQNDHVATVLFASWPGGQTEFYEDLWRAARRCPTLGRFVTLDEYFDATHGSDMPAMFEADAFRAPVGDAESACGAPRLLWERILRRHELERQRLLSGLTELVAPVPAPAGSRPESFAEPKERLLGRIAAAVCRPPDRADGASARGVLAINLAGQPRTICFAAQAVAATSGRDIPDHFTSDVPGIGFGWLSSGSPVAPPVPMADGLILRNERFEVHINRDTGGIGSVHDFRRRRNRLSQQLAVRLGGNYTRMVADDVRVTAATAACGEITSTGRLLDERGGDVGRFQQATRLLRGSRLIELAMELSSLDPARLRSDQTYAAVRWAWRDEPAELRRGVNGASFLTRKKRFSAADFAEIVEDDGRLVVFTEGPATHVHMEENRLNTLLPMLPNGPPAQTFRIAIGFDLEGAAGNWSHDWHSSPLATAIAGVPVADRAWWILCGSPSVRWTALGPLRDGRSGFFGRMQELTGRYVKTRVEAFRPIRSARKTNLRGESKIELPVRDGRIDLQMAGYQWIQLEAEWE